MFSERQFRRSFPSCSTGSSLISTSSIRSMLSNSGLMDESTDSDLSVRSPTVLPTNHVHPTNHYVNLPTTATQLPTNQPINFTNQLANLPTANHELPQFRLQQRTLIERVKTNTRDIIPRDVIPAAQAG